MNFGDDGIDQFFGDEACDEFVKGIDLNFNESDAEIGSFCSECDTSVCS